jgi:hypothetical protein
MSPPRIRLLTMMIAVVVLALLCLCLRVHLDFDRGFRRAYFPETIPPTSE